MWQQSWIFDACHEDNVSTSHHLAALFGISANPNPDLDQRKAGFIQDNALLCETEKA
jgi:hypothetical protein